MVCNTGTMTFHALLHVGFSFLQPSTWGFISQERAVCGTALQFLGNLQLRWFSWYLLYTPFISGSWEFWQQLCYPFDMKTRMMHDKETQQVDQAGSVINRGLNAHVMKSCNRVTLSFEHLWLSGSTTGFYFIISPWLQLKIRNNRTSKGYM